MAMLDQARATFRAVDHLVMPTTSHSAKELGMVVCENLFWWFSLHYTVSVKSWKNALLKKVGISVKSAKSFWL